MIEPQDLRIGNWLYFSEKSQYAMQVVGIYSESIELDFEGNESDVFDGEYEFVSGIPLTRSLFSSITSDSRNESMPITEIGGRFFNAMISTSRVFYLHELQNLYWVIYRKELAIDKEFI